MIERSSVDNSLRRAYELVDEHVGPIRQLAVHEIAPSDPPFFYATAQLASTLPFSDVEASHGNAGAGWNPSSAAMSALGEAIERYAIAIYREAHLVRGSYDALASHALDPRELTFFAEEQYAWQAFPYARVDPTEPMSWVRATSLLDGAERLVPAARVHTPYRALRPAELITQTTSTGAACHVDRERAILGGLWECIERDAFMIAWLNRFALPQLDPAAWRDEKIDTAIARLARRGLTATLFDATSDLACPTVVCALRGLSHRVPALAFGAATRGALLPAARKALIESTHTWFWVRTRTSRIGRTALVRDDARVGTLDDHPLFYADPRRSDRTDFLSEAVPTAVREYRQAHAPTLDDQRSVATELRRCIEVLRSAGLEAVVVDLTPDDIRAAGFVVVRVVVSRLHPLWGGHHIRCLGGERVRRVPVTLGYAAREPATHDLNQDPHPMP